MRDSFTRFSTSPVTVTRDNSQEIESEILRGTGVFRYNRRVSRGSLFHDRLNSCISHAFEHDSMRPVVVVQVIAGIPLRVLVTIRRAEAVPEVDHAITEARRQPVLQLDLRRRPFRIKLAGLWRRWTRTAALGNGRVRVPSPDPSFPRTS